LERLTPHTAREYLFFIHDFSEWLSREGGVLAGKSLEELLDLQDRAVGRERFRQLSLIQKWVDSKSSALKTKRLAYSAIRSFYLHNRVELPKDATFTIRGDYVPTQSEMSVLDFRKIVLAANRLYRAVFLCMFEGGMGERELLMMNGMWERVGAQLELGERLIQVNFPARKHNTKPFYTFLGLDSVAALKDYLAKERGVVKPGEAIFVNDNGNPLNAQNIRQRFLVYAMRSGLVKRQCAQCPKCGGEARRVHLSVGKGLRCLKCGHTWPLSKEFWLAKTVRYRMHPHEIRDLFRSEWQKTGADPLVAEFMMGHGVDPNNYNKFFLDLDYVREQYFIAEPYLDILSKEPRTVPKAELRDLEEKLKAFQADNRELNRKLEDASTGIRQENEQQIREMQQKIDDLTTVVLSLQEHLDLRIKKGEQP